MLPGCLSHWNKRAKSQTQECPPPPSEKGILDEGLPMLYGGRGSGCWSGKMQGPGGKGTVDPQLLRSAMFQNHPCGHLTWVDNHLWGTCWGEAGGVLGEQRSKTPSLPPGSSDTISRHPVIFLVICSHVILNGPNNSAERKKYIMLPLLCLSEP